MQLNSFCELNIQQDKHEAAKFTWYWVKLMNKGSKKREEISEILQVPKYQFYPLGNSKKLTHLFQLAYAYK